MLSFILFLIPLLTSIVVIFGMHNQDRAIIKIARISVNLSLLISVLIWIMIKVGTGKHWIDFFNGDIAVLGDGFGMHADAMAVLLCVLNGVVFSVVMFFIRPMQYKRMHLFVGLLLFMQSALFGVFLTTNVLIFYVFWELTLIPAYFLCSWYGAEKRIPVTFKFFIYTFFASIIMLVGILYVYYAGGLTSFALSDWQQVHLTASQQLMAFWLFIFAVAVKLPVFPFHTWQPDTYQQAPTQVTMVLSAIMVKMGVYLLLRYIAPIMPIGLYAWGDWVMIFATTGILYASIIALLQTDIKRLVAYASIAHMGLMALAFFSATQLAIQGIIIQMFNHGINILALWAMVIILENIYKTTDIRNMGGLATKNPGLAIAFTIIVFANIGLPLTNAFIGEWLMFAGIVGSPIGLFTWTPIVYALIAMMGVILSAIYMLRMLHKILFTATDKEMPAIHKSNTWLLIFFGICIILIGIFPQYILSTTETISQAIQQQFNIEMFIKK